MEYRDAINPALTHTHCYCCAYKYSKSSTHSWSFAIAHSIGNSLSFGNARTDDDAFTDTRAFDEADTQRYAHTIREPDSFIHTYPGAIGNAYSFY